MPAGRRDSNAKILRIGPVAKNKIPPGSNDYAPKKEKRGETCAATRQGYRERQKVEIGVP